MLRIGGMSPEEIGFQQERNRWTAGALFTTSVSTNTTLVQSPSLNAGIYEINLIIYCNAVALFALQLIDTDGTTVLKSQRFTVDFSSTREVKGWKVEITRDGQRIRVVNPDAITGDVQVSFN